MPAQLWERVSGAHGLLAFAGDVIDGPLLAEAGPSLVAVAVAGERFDHVDILACNAAAVSLTVTEPELSAASTAEHAVGLALALLRNTLAQDFAARTAGVTAQSPGASFGGSLLGASVAILGGGALAAVLAERLGAFGPASVTLFDPNEGEAGAGGGGAPQKALQSGLPLARAPSFPALLAQADVLFLAAPRLTPRTLRLVDGAALATLKPGCVIVNVAAGSLVDEAAVAVALQEGRLAGYAADCFACDDVHVPSRPHAIHSGLKSSARTLLTPRVGAAVAATAQRVELEAARALAEALDGRAPRGQLNDVPPRRAGERAGGAAAVKASKAAWGQYLWCVRALCFFSAGCCMGLTPGCPPPPFARRCF